MKRHIPLTALKFFRQAAESMSFKLAAEQLFVTQAAVSQQIKSLENSLNVKLFTRLNREVVLTEQGKKLLLWAICLPNILVLYELNTCKYMCI